MLEHILDSRQKVQVLRLLATRKDWIFSLSELSRELKIPKNTLSRNIKPLVEYSIIREFKKGKATVFQLNINNYIVNRLLSPLFDKENSYPVKKAEEFCKALNKTITTGIVFGSASRGNMTPSSDIDIALITKSPESASKIAEQLQSKYLKVEGILFSVHIYRLSDFKKQYAKKNPHIIDITNGTVVFGNIEDVI